MDKHDFSHRPGYNKCVQQDANKIYEALQEAGLDLGLDIADGILASTHEGKILLDAFNATAEMEPTNPLLQIVHQKYAQESNRICKDVVRDILAAVARELGLTVL